MSDYVDDGAVESFAYAQQIQELNNTIVKLRKHIVLLESEIENYQKIPVPKTIINQILELQNKNEKLQEDIDHYKKYLPIQIIINRENKETPTRKGGIPK